MNNENPTDTGAIAILLKVKIRDINDRMIICPAVMLANKRMVNENGFTNIPIISIGARNIFIATGTSGIQKICFQ